MVSIWRFYYPVMWFFFIAILILLDPYLAKSVDSPSVIKIDNELIEFFEKTIPSDSNRIVRSILERRSKFCQKALNDCLDITRISSHLCTASVKRIYRLPLVWTNILDNLHNKSDGEKIFKIIKNCSHTPTVSQLMAGLAFVVRSNKMSWAPLVEQSLEWIEHKWKSPPTSQLPETLESISFFLQNIRVEKKLNTYVLRRLAIFSTHWLSPKEINKIETGFLVNWSNEVGHALLLTGSGSTFVSKVETLSLSKLFKENFHWSVQITSARCRIYFESKKDMTICLKQLEFLKDHSQFLPDQNILIKILITQYGGDTDILTINKLIDSAKIWAPDALKELEMSKRIMTLKKSHNYIKKNVLQSQLKYLNDNHLVFSKTIVGPHMSKLLNDLDLLILQSYLKDNVGTNKTIERILSYLDLMNDYKSLKSLIRSSGFTEDLPFKIKGYPSDTYYLIKNHRKNAL